MPTPTTLADPTRSPLDPISALDTKSPTPASGVKCVNSAESIDPGPHLPTARWGVDDLDDENTDRGPARAPLCRDVVAALLGDASKFRELLVSIQVRDAGSDLAEACERVDYAMSSLFHEARAAIKDPARPATESDALIADMLATRALLGGGAA